MRKLQDEPRNDRKRRLHSLHAANSLRINKERNRFYQNFIMFLEETLQPYKQSLTTARNITYLVILFIHLPNLRNQKQKIIKMENVKAAKNISHKKKEKRT